MWINPRLLAVLNKGLQGADSSNKDRSWAIVYWWGRVVVTLGLGIYLLWRVHDQLFTIQINLVQPSKLGAAVGFTILGILLSTWLWRIFIPPSKQIPFHHLLSHYLVGMLWNHFLPGGIGGDAVRTISLRSSTGRTDVAINSVLMSRLVSLWSIVLLASSAALFQAIYRGLNQTILLLIISGGALLVTGGVTGFLFGAPVRVLIRRLPESWMSWHARLRDFNINPTRLLKAFLIALCIQFMAIMINLQVAQTLGLPVEAWQLWLSLPIITLVTLLPISIGGFGVRESTYVVLLGLFGVPATGSLVLSLAVYALLAVVTVAGSGICLLFCPTPNPPEKLSKMASLKSVPGVARGRQALKAIVPQIKRPVTPTDLIFFVTDRCNARCAHCFYRYAVDVSDGNEQLSLTQIEKVLISLRQAVSSVTLTGGEPFLRRDLDDICALFKKICDPGLIVLPTNGLLTEYITRQVDRICELEVTRILVQVSLDGLPDTHDAIRGSAESFERAISSVKSLKGLVQRHRNLEVAISTTISSRNIPDLEELAAYVHDELQIPHSFEVVRGVNSALLTPLTQDLTSPAHPLDPGSQPLSPDELLALYPRIERIYRQNTDLLTGAHPLWTPLATAYRVGRYRHLLDVVGKQRPFRCPAGKQTGVIYPNGDVALCEFSKPVGNLADFHFDFYALWESQPAQVMRAQLQRCFCTHGCFQTVAMMREPLMLGRMLSSAMTYLIQGSK